MDDSIKLSPVWIKILQTIVNVISGIAMLYFVSKIGHELIENDIYIPIVLSIFIIKFCIDLLTFKIGHATFSLLLLLLPIISLLGFGPLGEIQPLFNDDTQLIEKHFYTLAFSSTFFYYSWSLLLLMMKKNIYSFDLVIVNSFSVIPKSVLATWIFSFISVAATIIYLPDLPGKSYGEFSNSLLPGNAWNSVAVIAYFFVLIGSKGSLARNFALIFVPFWLLSHFARVDILGLILLLYLIVTNFKKGEIRNIKFNFPKVFILISGAVLFAYLGVIRNSGLVFDFQTIIDSILLLFNYLTVQDLIYSTAAAIEVAHTQGNQLTLINYISQMIPSFIMAPGEGAPHIVASYIHTNFGLLIYGEYYLNYSFIGILVAPFATYFILFFPLAILRKLFGDLGTAIGYYMIVTTTARVMWYGYIYYIKPLVIILPILLIVYILIEAIEKDAYRKTKAEPSDLKLYKNNEKRN